MEPVPYYPESRPTVAFALSMVAALLVFFNALLLGAAGNIAGSFGDPAASSVLWALSAFGVFLALLIFVFALRLFQNPDAHTGYGVAILIASVFSLAAGGGFILGLILGVIGGILAIFFEPDSDAPWPASAPVPLGSGATGRVVACPRCGTPALGGAISCPRCDTLLPSL